MSPKLIKHCNCCKKQYFSEDEILREGTRFRMCSGGMIWFNCRCESTLMLDPERLKSFDPSKGMSTRAKKVFEALQTKAKIPAISNVAMQLTQALDNSETTIEQIADILKREPILAANIIEVASQQSRSKGQDIRNINHAIVYIGRKKLKDTTWIAAIKTMELQTKHFSLESYSSESFAAGFLAERLVTDLQRNIEPDRAYIAACLANIGKLLQAHMFPVEADNLHLKLTGRPNRDTWGKLELDTLPGTHTTFGEIAGILWGASKDDLTVIGSHHDHNSLFKSPGLSLLDVCSTAVQLSNAFCGRPFQSDDYLIKRFLRAAGKDEAWLESFLSRATSAFRANHSIQTKQTPRT